MKKIVLTLAVSIVTFTAMSQIGTTEFEMVKSVFNVEKKAMLTQFLELSEEDSKAFWPIYNNYERERGEVGNKRMRLLNRYAEQYEAITNEQADALVLEAMDLQKKDLAIKKKYYNQVKKSLSAKIATSFWQFEEYVQTAVRLSLYEGIPFVGEM